MPANPGRSEGSSPSQGSNGYQSYGGGQSGTGGHRAADSNGNNARHATPSYTSNDINTRHTGYSNYVGENILLDLKNHHNPPMIHLLIEHFILILFV